MEWKILTLVFLVSLFATQVASNCPDGCFCEYYYFSCVRAYLKTVPSDLSSEIQILDLSVNEIKDLTHNSFSSTPDLELLILNDNRITVLSNGVFDKLSKLRSLHLHRNKIDTIENEAFKNLENLNVLSLHYNNIAQIDTGVFDTLVHLEGLNLNNNPLNCDCEISWLVDSLRERKNAHISGICNAPKSLRGESLSTLEIYQFTECAPTTIIEQPINIEIPESGFPSVTLRCLIRTHPKPLISWKKDGKIIQFPNDKYEQVPGGLIIKSVTLADVGKYQCVANNSRGRFTTVVAQLKSGTAKTTTGKVSPAKVSVVEGHPVVITCTMSTKQYIKLEWLRDNTIFLRNSITMQEVINGTLVSTLTLKDIRFDESGHYQCVSITAHSQIVYGSSEITVEDAPKIIKHSDDLVIGKESTTAELRCIAIGYPTPQISWFKNDDIVHNAKISLQENDTVLKIENASEKDNGMYSCVAKNRLGSVKQKIELRIQKRDSKAPLIIQKPFDMCIPKFSNIILPCKTVGNPQPSIQWLKNNESLIKDDLKFRIVNNGSLRILNASSADSGIYKCIASNAFGNDTASGTLTVLLDLEFNSIIDDAYIQEVVKNATLKVERAIDVTLDLISSKAKIDQSPGFLRSLYRFPDEYTRNISKCREVFFITLNLTDAYVRKHFKLSQVFEIRPEQLFSPKQLNLIKKLSGCEASAAVAHCSANMEFHSKYATLDGTCNNLKHPQWGASYTAFRRLLKPNYANGIDTPIAWNKDLKYYGYPRPSPRLVSSTLIKTNTITPDKEITHLVMQWGQFMDHDLDHAPPSVTTQSFNGVKCSDTCEYDEPCFAIKIPANDSRHPEKSCFEFIRSTSILAINDADNSNDIPYREQLNQPTSYIDGSMVYGFNQERSLLLRDLESNLGLLKTGDKNYLPTARNNFSVEVDCKLSTLVNDTRPNPGCYFAGDVRVNEMVGLLSMHTIWFREHNRLAKELKKINPQWNGDKIFYEARKILAAELQHITYQYWLKHIIGPEGIENLGAYKGYDENIQATISNVFATAALRVGHTIIQPVLVRLDHNYEVIPEGELPLSKSFFAPWRLSQQGGVDPVVRGFYAMPAKRKYPQQNLNEQIIDHLFENRTGGAMDLAALNIQRSRDHGLPGYAAYRKVCNLPEPKTFQDLKSDISDNQVRDKLKELYGHPGNIDVWVGGILEDQRKGAIVGPLFQCLITEQFKRLRDGDRFWYENPTTFTPSQLAAIKSVTLSRIFCDNGDNITTVSKDVFILPSLQNPSYVSCETIPKVDLKPWSSSTG